MLQKFVNASLYASSSSSLGRTGHWKPPTFDIHAELFAEASQVAILLIPANEIDSPPRLEARSVDLSMAVAAGFDKLLIRSNVDVAMRK